ncbi:MAG: hypothetical protein HeimAB125_09650 [Candidatus Heimdallarchaeota archaeon AB_125]|nr:MAG: hypothetical protein HeimAB125_09650 [Candidatus Heimdallarchaeota archaeon AB_125]
MGISSSITRTFGESQRKDVISLTPYLLTWEITSQNDESVSFTFTVNFTVTNTYITPISISFGSSCLWWSGIDCVLNNNSLEYQRINEFCLLVVIDYSFPPGQTNMSKTVGLRLYDPTILKLPEGYYEVIIGKGEANLYEEIIGPASVFLEVINDNYTINYNENPLTLRILTYRIPFIVVISCFVLLYMKQKKRNK